MQNKAQVKKKGEANQIRKLQCMCRDRQGDRVKIFCLYLMCTDFYEVSTPTITHSIFQLRYEQFLATYNVM